MHSSLRRPRLVLALALLAVPALLPLSDGRAETRAKVPEHGAGVAGLTSHDDTHFCLVGLGPNVHLKYTIKNNSPTAVTFTLYGSGATYTLAKGANGFYTATFPRGSRPSIRVYTPGRGHLNFWIEGGSFQIVRDGDGWYRYSRL